MSLVTAMCGELILTVRKREVTLELLFQDGQLRARKQTDVLSDETGITVAARINSQLQGCGVEVKRLEEWLLGVLAVNPSLTLFFNGRQLHSPLQSAPAFGEGTEKCL